MAESLQKTVLITGCSEGGLGDALAQRFHIAGYRVFATARNTNKLINLFPGIQLLGLDVTSDNIKDCVEEVSKLTGGTLNMLVNNAGIGYIMPLSDADLQISRQVFELNVFTQLAVTQAFLPLILKSKGTIVNQTCIASVINSPLQGIYSASKAAAAMLNDTLRAELKPFGIKVVELKSGLVKTNFLGNQVGTAHLPRNSIFNIARLEVEEKLLGVDYADGSMSRDEYAKQVVAELIKDNPPIRIWKGGRAYEAWLASTFAPTTAPEHALAYVGALDVVTQRVKEKEKEEKEEHRREPRVRFLQFCKHRDRRHVQE
jgi:1-acylglycerone phosphate reductase